RIAGSQRDVAIHGHRRTEGPVDGEGAGGGNGEVSRRADVADRQAAGIGDREVVVGAGEHRIEHAVGKVFRGDRVVAADRGRTVALEHLRRGDGEVAGRGEGPERLDVAIAHDQFDAAAVELDVARATGVVQQDVALAARHARAHDQVPGTVEAGTR